MKVCVCVCVCVFTRDDHITPLIPFGMKISQNRRKGHRKKDGVTQSSMLSFVKQTHEESR